MNYNVVDRGADTCGKRPSKRIGKVFEGRNGSVVTDKFHRYPIQLEGRHAWFNMFGQFCKGFTNQVVSLAHQLNFIFGL